MRRLPILGIVAALLLAACGGGPPSRTYHAQFSRAIQLFPGTNVRVLGVDVGLVRDVEPRLNGVDVTFTIDDPQVQVPEDVQAAIVPASLLGERYVQLFPAYVGGPTLEEGATIPISRTAVPAEPDELLRSLQDYLGALDPDVVAEFVHNAADVLRGTGANLNATIHHGARVLATLAAKGDDLARIVVEFERLTSALSTRQDALARLINSYNDVAGTVTGNRSALEGTIEGLNEMAVQLASLLLEHENPLHADIAALTRTGRTLSRNVEDITRTGHWAERLFRAAQNAVDFDADWLRLNNQGQELPALIVMRLKQRLVDWCSDLGLDFCSTGQFWARGAPSLFCFEQRCPARNPAPPEEQLTTAIEQAPALAEDLLQQARRVACLDAANPDRCRARRAAIVRCLGDDHPRQCLRRHELARLCRGAPDPQACLERQRHRDLERIVKDLLEGTVGNQSLGGLP